MTGSVRRSIVLLTAFAVVLAVFALWPHSSEQPRRTSAGDACAPGYQPVEDALAEVRAEMRSEGEHAEDGEDGEDGDAGEEHDSELVREAVRELPMLAGTDPEDWPHLCVISKRPESLAELETMAGGRAMARLAPAGSYSARAGLAAVRQSEALARTRVPGTAGKARQYGVGPLIVNDEKYPEVNGLGLVDNMGRIDSYAYDQAHHRLFAAVGNGGIWRSDDRAASWQSAQGDLPTTVTGAVGWSRARGGTLLALTGEPTFGSSAYTGLGAYWSADLGRHWHRAKHLPSGALGFAIAVDPNRPRKVYAATQLGLFVSRDAGRSYRNADLPTGQKCAGVTNTRKRPECALRSVVTDVVVAPKGGIDSQVKPGTVLASVGWRGGQRTNNDGSVQSENNGMYRSASGAPGTFEKLEATGLADQASLGRIELGNAVGAGQDHDFVYAMVQDANLLNNGGVGGIDVPEGTNPPLGSTVFNGLYVSADFGQTWTSLAQGSTLAADPLSGSALVGTGTATGYQPGVQAWYNEWVQPDPTRATSAGVPTRLAFGLEEIWSNEPADQGLPLDGSVPVHFRVVAKYFGGDSCLLLSAGLPYCPGDREPTDDNQTTHPDQQDGIWVPDDTVENGGVQLYVGNDGGAYRYRFEDDSDAELDNSNWGPGDQAGFSTLMPYWAAVANDGTVWAGLQDNGNLKIDGATRKQYETYGGDGFFSAVDPSNSDIAYEEYTNGAISITQDGGTSWSSADPGLTASKFSNPFAMDPTNAKHLMTAGREVAETLIGPNTTDGMTDAAAADDTTTTWLKVYDLGTRSHPGDAAATSSAEDPANSMSAVAVRRSAAYVGFCGQCDTLNKPGPAPYYFKRGLATNVGGDKAPKAGTADGWHIVKTHGLPNRYITSIAIDPKRKRTIYVTLGGYTRRWLPPGSVGDKNKFIGDGHLFVSRDGGQHFRDITGNLPDAPAMSVTLRAHQLLVGTDVGAFASSLNGTKQATPRFARLKGLPLAPVSTIALKPDNPNRAFVAQFGRGIWSYDFKKRVPVPPAVPPAPPAEVGTELAAWDFEADDQGWTSAGVPGWTRGTPGHGTDAQQDDAGNAWSVSGPVGYMDNADTTVTSPATTVPGTDAVVEWWMKLDTEGGFDKVTVEWSADGSTWKPIGTYSGQSGTPPAWQKYSIEFHPTAGPVQLQFHFTSDSLCSNLGGPLCSSTAGWDGVHVDDVRLGTP
jgi:hypothetical protein